MGTRPLGNSSSTRGMPSKYHSMSMAAAMQTAFGLRVPQFTWCCARARSAMLAQVPAHIYRSVNCIDAGPRSCCVRLGSVLVLRDPGCLAHAARVQEEDSDAVNMASDDQMTRPRLDH